MAAFFMARALSVLIESEPGSGLLFGRFSLREPVSTSLEHALIADSVIKRPRPARLHRCEVEDDEVLVDENAPPRSGYETG